MRDSALGFFMDIQAEKEVDQHKGVLINNTNRPENMLEHWKPQNKEERGF